MPGTQADARELRESAFDSQKEWRNYTNPLTESVHAFTGLPTGRWIEGAQAAEVLVNNQSALAGGTR